MTLTLKEWFSYGHFLQHFITPQGIALLVIHKNVTIGVKVIQLSFNEL